MYTYIYISKYLYRWKKLNLPSSFCIQIAEALLFIFFAVCRFFALSTLLHRWSRSSTTVQPIIVILPATRAAKKKGRKRKEWRHRGGRAGRESPAGGAAKERRGSNNRRYHVHVKERKDERRRKRKKGRKITSWIPWRKRESYVSVAAWGGGEKRQKRHLCRHRHFQYETSKRKKRSQTKQHSRTKKKKTESTWRREQSQERIRVAKKRKKRWTRCSPKNKNLHCTTQIASALETCWDLYIYIASPQIYRKTNISTTRRWLLHPDQKR